MAIFAVKADAQTVASATATNDKIQKETKQGIEVQNSGDTLVAASPRLRAYVSQEMVKYLELSQRRSPPPDANEKERGQVQPLVKRLARNWRAMTAAHAQRTV